MADPIKICILLFNDVEVLDFCGPFEVFSIAGFPRKKKCFDVFTVSERSGPIIARNNLSINPHYNISNCPKPNILLIPGGPGTRTEMHNTNIIKWIQTTADDVDLLLSVCTGALLLAKAGLLKNKVATTHHRAVELLKSIAPTTTIVSDKRFVDNGKVVLSAGVSAGIDMSFYIIEKLLGKDVAQETAFYIEYCVSYN